MTRPHIAIHLTPDGHVLRFGGLTSGEVHAVRNCIKLAGRCPEKLRSYVHTATGITPVVTVARVIADPPSGPLVCGEEE